MRGRAVSLIEHESDRIGFAKREPIVWRLLICAMLFFISGCSLGGEKRADPQGIPNNTQYSVATNHVLELSGPLYGDSEYSITVVETLDTDGYSIPSTRRLEIRSQAGLHESLVIPSASFHLVSNCSVSSLVKKDGGFELKMSMGRGFYYRYVTVPFLFKNNRFLIQSMTNDYRNYKIQEVHTERREFPLPKSVAQFSLLDELGAYGE
jgi:hypothetical protein